MVTGSLQIKGLVYYVVLNVYPNNKRNQKWIPTTVIADGKKVNQIKAEKLLSDIRMIYNKDSYIDNKKTAEQLLEEQNQNKTLGLSLLSPSDTNNKIEELKLSNQPLSSKEELIITKCLSAWYNISKEEMIHSLMNIIKENPNTHLIKRIITDLVNKLSDDPREQRMKKMGHYRDMLFSDYIKEWLNSIQNQVAKSTYKGYYDHVNGRMIPYFENEELLLKDVTLADIYNYIEYLFSEGLKPNTVKHHRSILSCIFTRAVEQELFEYNFINNLKSIKSDHYIGNFYKHEELLHLFEVTENTTIRLEVIIAAVYGLRREEVLGLKWDCIDFIGKTITIKHTVQRFKINGKTQFVIKDKTKSQSSYRTLPLFDFIEDLLKEYKTMYAEYRKIFGNTYCTKYKDYVCLMPNGELMKPGYLSHTFSKLLEDNELKRIRLHDLRHSCATLLVQNKVPIKDIQIWLGHSNIQTTMIYTHLDETNKEVSAQVLVDKFQYILNNYNENELYDLKENTLNNIYEDIDNSNQFKNMKKVVATAQV